MQQRPLILLYGYCQSEAIGRILQRLPFISARFDVRSIANFPDPVTGVCGGPDVASLERCEYFFYQAGPYETLPPYARDLVEHGRSIRFPGLYCEPVWPQHRIGVRDPRCPELPYGRFPYGDSVLLGLLNSDLSERAIIEQYLAADLSRLFSLEPLLEQWRGLLEKLDHGCDISVGEFVWEHWRRRRLFWTVGHPANELLGVVVRGLLDRAFGDTVTEREIVSALAHEELDFVMAPVHPSVARALRLEWFSEDFRYTHWADGPLTCAEWAQRYVTYIRSLSAPDPGAGDVQFDVHTTGYVPLRVNSSTAR